MSKLTDDDMKLITSAQTEEEWYRVCDDVREAHGGHYPDDWYDRVLVTGLLGEIAARWGGDAELRVFTLAPKDE